MPGHGSWCERPPDPTLADRESPEYGSAQAGYGWAGPYVFKRINTARDEFFLEKLKNLSGRVDAF
jgi:hypothetical protein